MGYASIVLFCLAAVFGPIILITWLQKRKANKVVVYTHGFFAVCAVTLLVAYAFTHPGSMPVLSLILFGATAILGLYMFFSFRGGKPPIVIAFIHGGLAVAALITLVLFVFAHTNV